MARYTLFVIGVLLIWLTNVMGAPSETAEDYDRLRTEAERYDGVVTEIREREVTERRRRGSTTRIVYCPEVAYQRSGEDWESTFVEYEDCAEDAYAVGDAVTVLVDPDDPYDEHIDSDAVRDSLAGDERTFGMGFWMGWGLVLLCGPFILWGWFRGFQRARRGQRI